MTLRGNPEPLDLLLRPLLRAIEGLVAVIFVTVLAVFGLWWWLPVPVIALEIAYQAFVYWRSDRACSLELGETLVLRDPKLNRILEVRLADVHAAKVLFRRAATDRVDVFVTLATATEPVLAVRLECRSHAAKPDDVDLDAMGATIGGNAGVLRGFAPVDRTCRQRLEDLDGTLVLLLRAKLRAEVFGRTCARIWIGEEPEMDLLGVHAMPEDAFLTLEGRRFTLDGPTPMAGELARVSGARCERSVVLIRFADDAPDTPTGDTTLPMLVLGLSDDLILAFPSTLAGTLGPETRLEPSACHTHLAEGTAVAWHLLTHLDTDELPRNLVQAVGDARVVGPLPPALTRHLGPAPQSSAQA